MASKAHFVKLSNGLHRLWTNEELLDVKLITADRPVEIHKVILIVFSSFHQRCLAKTGKIPDIPMREYTSDQVCDLLHFLYSGDIKDDVPAELIKHLKLDLTINQSKTISERMNLKGSKLKQFSVTELKYLRSYTLEMEVPKLLYNGRAGSDVIIRTGKDVHKCHKVILAAMSAYFDVMFNSGMREAEETMINLHGVETKIFSKVLSFIYTGLLDITVGNAQELLTTSVYLQIPDLQQLCEEFLLRQIDVGNCADMLKLGKSYNCHSLGPRASEFIVDNFESIGKPKLKDLDRDDVLELVTNDNLNVGSEKDVLMFVLQWTMADRQNRESHLSSLLNRVRLTLLKASYLEEIVKNNDIINKSESCVKHIETAIDEIRKGDTSSEPRKESTFLVFKTTNFKRGVEVVAYSLSQKKWFSLCDNAAVRSSSGLSACVSKSYIYLTGGRAQPKQAWIFIVDSNCWHSLPELNSGRCAHSSACVDGSIHVLGGTDVTSGQFGTLSSVEKYDEKLAEWRIVGHLEIPTYDSACAVVKSCIYILGGAIGVPGMYIKDIQCFNTVSGTCTILYHNLPMPISLSVACAHHKDIYITCPRGEVIHFNQDDSPSYLCKASGSTSLGYYGSIYHGDALYTLGGFSHTSETSNVTKFDLKTKTKSSVRQMKLPFEKHSNEIFATVMHVCRRHLTNDIFESESRRRVTGLPFL